MPTTMSKAQATPRTSHRTAPPPLPASLRTERLVLELPGHIYDEFVWKAARDYDGNVVDLLLDVLWEHAGRLATRRTRAAQRRA